MTVPLGVDCTLDSRLLRVALRKLAILDAARINEIAHGERRISADTALRLARYFGTSDLFWVNLQIRYDLEIERDNLGTKLDGIQPLQSA